MSLAEGVLKVSQQGNIATIALNRPAKHNALSELVFGALKEAFQSLSPEVRVVILRGEGKSFCAGLDLAQHRHREPFESVLFSRYGHDVFNAIELGGRPVVAALHGAVIGGGLEMACCAHVRVADETAFYQLPEARRGIYVGGGASVRVSRVIGSGRLMEMMLTGRKYSASEGLQLGLSHYVVKPGKVLKKAIELAATIAENAIIPNYLITQAIPRIADMSAGDGLFTESIAQAITLTSADAKTGIEQFLHRRRVAKQKKGQDVEAQVEERETADRSFRIGAKKTARSSRTLQP